MRFLALVLFFVSGCANAVLTSPGKVYPRTSQQGFPVQCAVVNELLDEDSKPACWCMFPSGKSPGLGVIIPFVLSPTAMCEDGDVRVPVVERQTRVDSETL